MTDITKLLERDKAVLEGEDMKALKDYISALKSDAECAGEYREELIGRLSKSFKNRGISLSYDISRGITAKLSVAEIKALIDAVGEGENKIAAPQLCRAGSDDGVINTEFRI